MSKEQYDLIKEKIVICKYENKFVNLQENYDSASGLLMVEIFGHN